MTMADEASAEAALEAKLADRFSRVLVSAVAVVANRQGEVLFVRQPRGPFAGSWLLPGGGIEQEEDAIAAVRRETLEETGVLVEAFRFVRAYEVFGEWRHGPFHFILLAFAGEVDDTAPPSLDGRESVVVCWATPQQIELHPTDLRMLADAGVRDFSESEIERSLAQAGLRMCGYP